MGQPRCSREASAEQSQQPTLEERHGKKAFKTLLSRALWSATVGNRLPRVDTTLDRAELDATRGGASRFFDGDLRGTLPTFLEADGFVEFAEEFVQAKPPSTIDVGRIDVGRIDVSRLGQWWG